MAYSAIPITPGSGGGTGDGTRIINSWAVPSGHPFVQGNVVSYVGGATGLDLAQADQISNSHSIGIVETASANTISVVYQGHIDLTSVDLSPVIQDGSESLTAGNVYYISQSNAGKLSSVRPPSGLVQGILVATESKKGIVINSLQGSQPSGSTVSFFAPIGSIIPWAGDASQVPASWKLCEGEAVRKSGINPIDSQTYTYLYSAIGDRYRVTALVDSVTGDTLTPTSDLIVSFANEGHHETPSTAPCHGLFNASTQDVDKDYKIGWGGTNDYAIGSITSADESNSTVRLVFKQSYPGTTPKENWSSVSLGLPVTIQSLSPNEVAGCTSERFFIPDLRARSVFGAGYSTGLSQLYRGEIGGESVHLLTTNEIPDHNNAVNAIGNDSSGSVLAIDASITSTDAYSTLNAPFTADNDPIALMPPYAVTNWIIRYDLMQGVAIEVGPTGPTGDRGETGYGFTAAFVSGDGELYISVLFPNGSSGAPYSIGNVAGDAPPIGGSDQQILFNSGGNADGSANFLFDGTSATFGGAGTIFTMTGPTFAFGHSTRIKDGVFVNPKELSYYADNGTANLEIGGASGAIQRYTVTPQSDFTVSVDTAEGKWSNETNVTETVIVALQYMNSTTGSFGSNIITGTPRPILGGSTGSIDIFSLMRIKTQSSSLVMGFLIQSGMTGSDISIAN